MAQSPRRKTWRYRRLISEHAFDKLHLLDCTFAEFEAALEKAQIIEEHDLGEDGVKELSARRAKLTERAGRVAVVLGVPMEECTACGDRWLDFDIARRLDEILTGMVASDAEIVTRHFDTHQTAA